MVVLRSRAAPDGPERVIVVDSRTGASTAGSPVEPGDGLPDAASQAPAAASSAPLPQVAPAAHAPEGNAGHEGSAEALCASWPGVRIRSPSASRRERPMSGRPRPVGALRGRRQRARRRRARAARGARGHAARPVHRRGGAGNRVRTSAPPALVSHSDDRAPVALNRHGAQFASGSLQAGQFRRHEATAMRPTYQH